jgi:tRNA modification GTPase
LAVEARLLGLSAEIEAWLDFPEDISEPEIDSLAQKARQIMGGLDLLLVEARRGRLLTEGAMVAIVGRPNVGKSSLLNALLGEERAIVTDLPGTTRDAVAEEISLDGLPIRFVDTAGLGQTEDRLETLGMVRSRREIARADLILLVFDASEPLTDSDREIATELSKKGQGIAVLNKADLPGQLVEAPEPVSSWPTVAVSALTKHGLPALTGAILNALGGQPAEAVPVLSHLRQIEAAAQARAALAAFAAGLGEGVALDVLAEELRASLASLARITGREVGPDLLREIFSRFCLGK